jgi:hypothetical protein
LPKASPFQGGFLCIKAPIRRTGTMNSGGSASGTDCTGFFDFAMNAHIQGGADPTLVTGADIHCQFWSRDPGSASQTNQALAGRRETLRVLRRNLLLPWNP